MSKIPFTFTAIPNYLIDAGWMDDPKTARLIIYMFRRCRGNTHIEVINNREVVLEPYEFIFGRDSVAKETGLSGKEVRHRMGQFVASKWATIVASKTTSKYTVYRWVTASFSENEGQQKGQVEGQQMGTQRASIGPADGPQSISESENQRTQIYKEVISESDHPRPHQNESPVFTNKENKAPMPEEDDTLGGSIFRNLRIMDEIKNDPKVKAFRLMDGSKPKPEELERWIAKTMEDFYHLMDWYNYRAANKKKQNQKKAPHEQEILQASYIEECLSQGWLKVWIQRKFARAEDEKQTERHRRNS